MKYKMMKVFDCQDMPRQLCCDFLESFDNKINDSSVDWNVQGNAYDDEFCLDKRVDDWLLDGGATKWEEVIIKYWW